MLRRVSDRELRDEIEQLSDELREARKELEFTGSVSGGANQLRLLTAELTAAKAQNAVLKQQIPATEALVADRKEEKQTLQAELVSLRKQIADLDPLPNPYDSTQPDWSLEQSETPGCLQVVLVFGALGAAWWLT
jgi:chromosome segregation ATPase